MGVSASEALERPEDLIEDELGELRGFRPANASLDESLKHTGEREVLL